MFYVIFIPQSEVIVIVSAGLTVSTRSAGSIGGNVTFLLPATSGLSFRDRPGPTMLSFRGKTAVD